MSFTKLVSKTENHFSHCGILAGGDAFCTKVAVAKTETIDTVINNFST